MTGLDAHVTTPRQMWGLLEPIHAVTYFAEESLAAARGVGYRGFWMAYFAFRLAPLGPVGSATAAAACFGFHSSRPERALPDAWSYAAPQEALRARLDGATAALGRLFTGLSSAGPSALAATADLAWEAALRADTSGRVLAAANQDQPRPEDPIAALWQATTTLREHRGDGHNAVLIATGVTPVQAHWLKIAAVETDPEALRDSRNWPEPDWARGQTSCPNGAGWTPPAGSPRPAGSRTAPSRPIPTLPRPRRGPGSDRGPRAGWRSCSGRFATRRLAPCPSPIPSG